MVITRHGNCADCGRRIIVTKDFIETVDMFSKQNGNISREISKDVKAWRDEAIYCEEHLDERD